MDKNNVSFGTLSCVEQPDETLKKYNGGFANLFDMFSL